jgi:hypothetical protein
MDLKVLLVMSCLLVIAATSNDSTKGEPRVTLKNSIAYHSIKNVKSIEMELFVTRKIDVSPVLKGIDKIRNIRDRVLVMCKRIPVVFNEARAASQAQEALAALSEVPKDAPGPSFHLVPITEPLTRPEARGKCAALGYQLPEVYTTQEKNDLIQLMMRHDVPVVHAGIIWDFEFHMHRFITTGYPAWVALQRRPYLYNGDAKVLRPATWEEFGTKSELRFFYTKYGTLGAFREHNVMSKEYEFYRNYWTWSASKTIDEFATADLICQTRWNGSDISVASPPTYWNYTKRLVNSQHIVPTDRDRRSVVQPKFDKPNILPLEELCQSVAGHMTETIERSQYRLVNALQQVDISLVNQLSDADVNKRSAGEADLIRIREPRSIAGVIFKSGVKNIWSLMGFIEKVRIRRKLGKLESLVNQQGLNIAELSREIANHSYAISQLTLVTRDLSNRLDSLAVKVTELEAKVSTLGTEIRTQQLLQLLDSLIGRTDQALNFAFTTLENIIQHALIGQASAFLLPSNKLEELQVEVNKVSSAIVDTSYERMRTTIVSDPLSAAALTCFVSLFAMTRKTRELVKLTPIPWYQGIQALAPSLDYRMVLLDQEEGTYIVIEPYEENGCLEDKCITSNPEVSTTAVSCGIPQMFDRHLTACVNEDVQSNGMYLKQLIYDGIIYSVKGEVDVQIFCKPHRSSKGQKLSGSGLIHLPSGCSLALTDSAGAVIRIQSSPLSHLFEAQGLELIPQGPHEIFSPSEGPPGNATTTLVRLLNQQIAELDHRLAVTKNEVNQHNFYVILLGTLLGVVSVICIVTALLLYRYSRRFRRRVRTIAEDLRTGLSEARRTFITFEQMAAQRARDEEAEMPLIPPSAGVRVLPPVSPAHIPLIRSNPGPAPKRRPMTKHDSLNSLVQRLADLELQVLAIDDSVPSDGYTTPIKEQDKSGGASYVAPPLPPKPPYIRALAMPYKNSDELSPPLEPQLVKAPNLSPGKPGKRTK